MAEKVTLYIKGIKGESKYAVGSDKEKEVIKGIDGTAPIDVVSWSWGMVQTGAASCGAGGGAGTSQVSDLTFTKIVDKMSPTLCYDCFTAAEHSIAKLVCWKEVSPGPGKPPVKIPYLQITMGSAKDGICRVSSVNHGGVGEGGIFLETLSLHFDAVEVTYVPEEPAGAAGTAINSPATMKIGT